MPKSEPLRELLAYQRFFEDKILEAEGEVSDDIFEQMLVLKKATPAKVEAMIAFFKHCEVKAKEWKEKADILSTRSKMYSNTLERCRDYVKTSMIDMKYDEIVGNDFKFCIEGGSDSVDITEEHLIPAEFTKLTPSYDKMKIKSALKSGQKVPGAKLIEGKKLVVRAGEKKRKSK